MATRLPDAGATDVLYLIDLSGYIFRAYHAITPLSSPTGEPTHAVLGTVNMLERLVRERRPAMLAVAMDTNRRTFRRELYPEYKAHRPPAPPDLAAQMQRCAEIVEAFAIPVYRTDGVEADDLIAAAVAQARQRRIRVVIVSADKDLMPLVGADVVLWDTMRDKVFGPEEVRERFGVDIHQVRDLLALVGDTSDNVPGVPSVGPKTARDLLLQYGTLDGIYENLDQIQKKRLRETLAEHRDQAFLSRDLITLKADLDVKFDPAALRYGGRDVATLRRLYSELGFRRHLTALDTQPEPVMPAEEGNGAPKPAPAPEKEATSETVTDAVALQRLAERIRSSGRLAVHVEIADGDPLRAPLVGLALCTEAGHSVYVPVGHRYVGAPSQLPLSELVRCLGGILSDPTVKKCAHDAKAQQIALSRHGMDCAGFLFDPQIASYLIDPEASHRLADLAGSLLGTSLPARDAVTRKARGKQLGFDEVPVEEAAAFAGAYAEANLRFWERLEERLAGAGLTRVFEEIEMPLAGVLAEMEQKGVLVDVALLGELGRRIEGELADLEREAHRIAGRAFNVNSPRQLETLLFDELGLRPLRRTKTSRSTDAATLEALAEQHALPKVILEIRQLAKLKGTYIDALPLLVNPETGRIHTRWDQAVAATGRLSSHDPNLQNIPIRSELGRSIRGAFVAPPGHQLVSADYSQIELRVLAHLSQDPVLIEAFRTGQDVHTRTAIEIFGVAESEVTSELRRRAKAVNFGVIYGQGDSGLAKSLRIPRTEASTFIAAYFRRYEGVRRFMDETLQSARAGDAVRTLFGRRRLVPDVQSGNRARRLAAERVAMNTPIQGTAADLLKLSMLALAEPVTPGTRMILTVHDELVFEVPDAEVAEAKERIRVAMENVHPLDVPLVVDVGHGPTWRDAH